MKSVLWEREGGKNPTKPEGSVMMTKKGEKSQTCLINVFNFFLFAEPPGSVARKGLLEGAGRVREGVRLEVMLSGPSSHSILWPQHLSSLPGGWIPRRQLFPRCPRQSRAPHSAGLFPARRWWPSMCGTGEPQVQACPGLL